MWLFFWILRGGAFETLQRPIAGKDLKFTAGSFDYLKVGLVSPAGSPLIRAYFRKNSSRLQFPRWFEAARDRLHYTKTN
jgi:hypothetical protein